MKSKRNNIKHKNRIKSMSFLAPSGLGVLTFFVVPFFVIIYYSLLDNPIQKNFVGFDNFIKVFQNSAFQSAITNTFVLSLIAVPMAVILSLLLAMLLDCKIP